MVSNRKRSWWRCQKNYRNRKRHPKRYWDAYALCEKLVDVDEQFQLWRFRHMKTVERIIGYKRGTGGSEGMAHLKKVIDKSFFPELFDVRSRIGADQQP